MNIPSTYFTYVNIGIIVLYALMMLISFKNGFLYGFLELAYTALSIAAAFFLAPVLSSMLPLVTLEKIGIKDPTFGLVDIEPILNTVIYFILIVLLLKLVGIFITPLFKNVSKIPVIGFFNRILGLVLGFVNATIIILVLGMMLNTPLFKNGQQIKEETYFRYIDTYSKVAMNYISDHADLSKFEDQLGNFDIDKAREAFREWLSSQEFMN